jgi:mono/diheme cytochrome c family protein
MAARRFKRPIKFALVAALALVLLLVAGITFTIGWRPFIGPKARAATNRKFDATPERLARGRYLVQGVVGCFDCHSKYDLTAQPAPALVGKLGGGQLMVNDADLSLVAPNITPDRETGVGAWTDDELARAIREGIGRDGRALFPAMPYMFYRQMSDEDLASVVVYLRSVEPVKSEPHGTTRIPFPLSRFINNVPQPLDAPVAPPDASTPARRGQYLATIGGCFDCHTPLVRGQAVAGMELAGGSTLQTGGKVASANITPDPSGISYYDEQLFLEVMRTGYVKGRKLSPHMPWWAYRNMTDEDLKSLFSYLRTVRPVAHRVDNTEPLTDCKLCQQRHGFGERN